MSSGVGRHTVTGPLIDWKNPSAKDFAIAGNSTKRPDLVPYVNGIPVGVIELKRLRVSVAEGIRQTLTNRECLLRRSAESWEPLTEFPALGAIVPAARRLVELRDRSHVSDGDPLALAGCGTKTQDHDLRPGPMGEPPPRSPLSRRRVSVVIDTQWRTCRKRSTSRPIPTDSSFTFERHPDSCSKPRWQTGRTPRRPTIRSRWIDQERQSVPTH